MEGVAYFMLQVLDMGLRHDLPVKVRLLDKEPRRELDDPDDLLGHVMTSWKDAGNPILKGICIGRLLQAYL